MNDNSSRLFLLREEKVPRALLKLGIPTMIGMMTSALYNLVDAFFVGKLGVSQVGAVAIVFPLGIILLGIGLLFGSGASSYIARLLGDKKYKEASECASTTLITSVGIGSAMICIMLVFLNPILRLLRSTDTILPFAKEYGVIFIIGLVINVFNITVNNIIVAEGASLYSMIAMLSGGVTNIILDPIFIFSFHMGIKGAALATLCARCVSFAIYLYYINSGKSVLKFSIKNNKPSKIMYYEVFKVGIPMLVFQLLSSFTLIITNFLAAKYGDSAVAALGVVFRIMSLVTMAVFGFLKGYQPFVGYNYGAGNAERVKGATNLTLKWTTIFCASVAIFLILFRVPIMSAFNKNNNSVLSIGCKAIIVNAIVFIGFGFQTVFGTMFLALGKAKQGGMISLGRQGVFFIPLAFSLTAVFNLNGLIISQSLADICSIILVIVLVKKYRNENKEYI